jgi:hypothetical protein
MTTITPHIFNQSAELQQLVLFPEFLGVTSVPLDQNKQEQVLVKELEEPQLSLKDQLLAGQMTVW